MAGVFLNDQRDPARIVTYSAERALLLREGDEARLVMLDGIALTPDSTGLNLNSVSFDQFVYDLSELVKEEMTRVPRPSEYAVTKLLSPDAEMLASGKYTPGDFVSEGHYNLTMPLLAMLYQMIALVTLLAGGYRRSGFGRRVIVAFAVAATILVRLFLIRERVQANPGTWPLMYLPHVLGLAYVAALLRWLSRSRRRPVRTVAA
jgi:lipopolysaccharide export system permease protein